MKHCRGPLFRPSHLAGSIQNLNHKFAKNNITFIYKHCRGPLFRPPHLSGSFQNLNHKFAKETTTLLSFYKFRRIRIRIKYLLEYFVVRLCDCIIVRPFI